MTQTHTHTENTLTPLPDMRKGMGIFSPVSGWMMAWGHNESTDSRQDEEEKTRENKRWERTDGRITMLRFSAILLSLHHYSEPQLVSVCHTAHKRCWVIWSGSFVVGTCKRLSTLFTLTCLIFWASQSYCEKQRETCKWGKCLQLFHPHLVFVVLLKLPGKPKFFTQHVWTELSNSDSLIGWSLLFCSHSY